MKRLRRTIHTSHSKKTTIDKQMSREDKQKETMSHWTSLSIDNSQINQNTHRPLGVSTSRMAFATALKRSHFYRKIISQSSNTHHYNQAENQDHSINHDDAQNSLNKTKIQSDNHSIAQEHSSNRLQVHPSHPNREKERGKLKSFEKFIQSRRKQNEKITIFPFKRTKIIRNIFNETFLNEKTKKEQPHLNLLGKGIKKLKDDEGKKVPQPNKEGNFEALWKTHQFMNSDDETVETPVKMRSIQSEWQSSKPPYIKYIFRDDQGYCFFDKIMNPLSPPPKSIQSHKKCLYYTMHRDSRKSKQQNKSINTTAVGNNIEGWVINTEEEEEF